MEGNAKSGLPAMLYQSENFTLDTDDYSLSRNGINHAIEPQVFNLLIYLIENRNHVVTRDELLENVWEGRIVSDSAINAGLKEARKAVGDTGKQQRVIKTIHRRGYQFIADVKVTPGLEHENGPRAPGSTSLTAKPSIAVLKFKNLSNDPEQDYFAQGVATTICSCLARIRSLVVKSGKEYDLSETNPADVAEELDVRYVLSGSVQREADHVRVFVELTEGISGDIRWSDRFDRHGNDVINIQDDIAMAITGNLWSKRGMIREAERERLAKKATSDFNAFDYILKGMSYKDKFRADVLDMAHECFDKAIELDPDSGEAYAWKAWVYIMEDYLGNPDNRAKTLELAISAAKKSIELDALSELGHWALAESHMLLGDRKRALTELEKASEINPNNPDIVITLGLVHCIDGRITEGLELIHKAMEFNKHFPNWYYWAQGVALFAGHRWQEAIEALVRMDEQNKDTLIYLTASYVQAGNQDEAVNCFRELMRLEPGFDPSDIRQSQCYLDNETQQLLIDSLQQLDEREQPQERLKIVKS